MGLWKTNLRLTLANGSTITDSLRTKCGIFQGESLSPFILCISLIFLSIEVNHLSYMDDLKLVARSECELTGLLDTVKKVSDYIGM